MSVSAEHLYVKTVRSVSVSAERLYVKQLGV